MSQPAGPDATPDHPAPAASTRATTSAAAGPTGPAQRTDGNQDDRKQNDRKQNDRKQNDGEQVDAELVAASRQPGSGEQSGGGDRVAQLVEQWELREAIGGVRGVVDSALASVVFLVTYVLDHRRLTPALVAALAVTVVLLGVRAARREPVRQALSGVLVVGVSALIAAVTGRAANFFVVGIALQAAYAVGYLVSLAVGWPLLGVLLGPLLGEGFRWRADPPRRRAYVWASWVWFAVFAVRVAVQVPLYLHDRVVSLGVSTLALGWPLFAVAAGCSWLLLRRVPLSVPEAHPGSGVPPTAPVHPGPADTDGREASSTRSSIEPGAGSAPATDDRARGAG